MFHSALIKIQILFLIIYFNWRIVTLQYCDGFCHTSTWISHGLPWWLNGKESTYNAGDLGLIPGLGRSPGGGHGNPLQYSCLEDSHGQRNLQYIDCTMGLQSQDTNDWLSTQKIQILISVVFCGSSGMKVKWVEKKRWNEHIGNVLLHIYRFFSNKHITFAVKLGKILLYAP